MEFELGLPSFGDVSVPGLLLLPGFVFSGAGLRSWFMVPLPGCEFGLGLELVSVPMEEFGAEVVPELLLAIAGEINNVIEQSANSVLFIAISLIFHDVLFIIDVFLI
ncbi:TPA: hypothetical protein ACPSKE_002963 [Legionella feeleii]